MSTCEGGAPRGPPKHQNKVVWKPNAGVKKNETLREVGCKQRPFPAISGVCSRCKQQIEWRRKYGKYKPLVEPGKCVFLKKKCLCKMLWRNGDYCRKLRGCWEEQQQKLLEAIKTLRERERRTLLRAVRVGNDGVKRPINKERDEKDADSYEEDSTGEHGCGGEEDECGCYYRS